MKFTIESIISEDSHDDARRLLLMRLGLLNLFMRISDILNYCSHVFVTRDEFDALIGSVLLELARYLINLIHHRLCLVECFLSLLNALGVKVNFSHNSQCLVLHLFHLLASLSNSSKRRCQRNKYLNTYHEQQPHCISAACDLFRK